MPQYIACPNADICSRTGFVSSPSGKIQECKFCGPLIRKTLNINNFLAYGWTTREVAETICRRDAKIAATTKVERELAQLKARNQGISNSQAKKFLRENTLKYEEEIFNDLKQQYKLL
jgi:hypothetical protein